MVPEFACIRRQLEDHSSVVLILDSPSSALRDLVLTERPDAVFAHGLVVKARVVDVRRIAKAALEVNSFLRVVPKSPFLLSAYAVWVSHPSTRSSKELRLQTKSKPKAGEIDCSPDAGRGSQLNENPGHVQRTKKKGKYSHYPVLYVITPRARGDVDDYIYEKRHYIDVEMTAAEMLYSLYLLHSVGFIHRDIKLMNYFVTYAGHVILGDFDGIWPNGVPVSTKQHLLYTKGYLAPEIDINRTYANYSEKSDIYALGICFKGLHGAKPNMRNAEAFNDLYRSMTAMNPEKRPTAAQAMQHSFFKNVDFSTLELLKHPPPLPGKFSVRAGFYG